MHTRMNGRPIYSEWAKQYFAAKDVANAIKQRAILLSACGATTSQVIKDVLRPQAPTDITFDTIVEKMTKHFQPTPSEVNLLHPSSPQMQDCTPTQERGSLLTEQLMLRWCIRVRRPQCTSPHGPNWLHHFHLDWLQMDKVHSESTDKLGELLDKHSSLFEERLGKITGTTTKLYMNSDAQPRFCRACPAPFSIRARVEQEIDHQVEEGILEPVQFSQWATTVVPVMKEEGRFSYVVIIRLP